MKKKLLKFCMPILMFVLFLFGVSAMKNSNAYEEENEEKEIILKKSRCEGGMWHTDKHSYKYKLCLAGKLPKADEEVIFVVLSNYSSITFDDITDIMFNKKSIFKEEEFILSEIKAH